MLKRSLEAIVAEERAKNHHVLANQLTTRLTQLNEGRVAQRTAQLEVSELWYERSPRLTFQDLVVGDVTLQTLLELIEEQHRADMLRSHGLEPRNRLLLIGPPGNGKTSVAEAIAEALAVPMVVPRYESIVGSYLGETSQRLRQLFDYVAQRRCALFFDEFDTVGKERADEHENGEIKRVVSSLLLQIDQLPSHVVVIGATNHPELLDRAAWRRFQIRIHLSNPTTKQLHDWVTLFSLRHKMGLMQYVADIAKVFKGASFSELDDFGLNVLRKVVLAGPDANEESIVRRELRFSAAGMGRRSNAGGRRNVARPVS